MDTADYWPMAREYSIWNATIASLQFWTEDLNPVTLGRATEPVYTIFFYSSTSHTLHQQSNETLFGCFVIALNAAFDQQLSLADEGYESGSDTINCTHSITRDSSHSPHFQHGTHFIQSSSHHTMQYTTNSTQTSVHRCLSFSSVDNYTPDSTPVCSDSSDDEEEDFQMVPLDDEHWTSEETPEENIMYS